MQSSFFVSHLFCFFSLRVQCRYFAKRIKKGLQNRLKKMALMRSPVSVIMADLTRIEKNRIHAPDDDPDPFLLKEVKPGEALPIYEVDGYELPRGIRPDQLRFGFTGDVNIFFFCLNLKHIKTRKDSFKNTTS